jgi:hypothetical protein
MMRQPREKKKIKIKIPKKKKKFQKISTKKFIPFPKKFKIPPFFSPIFPSETEKRTQNL